MRTWDFCTGNIPYQETKGGTKNVDVWPSFVDGANQIAHASCLIHPGRWVVPKKQMQKTRDKMINNGLVNFDYIPDSNEVFPNIRGVDGGITISYFIHGYTGDIEYSVNGNSFGIYDKNARFFSNKFEKEIFEKVVNSFPNTKTMLDRISGSIGSLGSSEFGYDKNKHFDKLNKSPKNMKKPIQVWAAVGFGKGTHYEWMYVEKNNINPIPPKITSTRKVMISKVGVAINSSKKAVGINGVPQIVDKDTTGENVFFIFPENDTDYDLNLIRSLFMTKTARFLMSITQKDLYVRGFENIPDYTAFIPMLNGKLFTDKFFYDNFDFSN